MQTRKDITLYWEAADQCWAFRSHSGKADAFLAAEFAAIGDRDLTQAKVNRIQIKAHNAGFLIVVAKR